MIGCRMQGLLARNAVALSAVVAAGVFVVQLGAGGIIGYRASDVVSLLLIAVPVAAHGLSAGRRRRRHKISRDDADDDRRVGPAVSPSPVARPADGGGGSGVTGAISAEPAGVIERMVVRSVASLVAVGAWLAAAVLVLLQAWIPALSALIVMGLAAAGMPSDRNGAPVAQPPDPG